MGIDVLARIVAGVLNGYPPDDVIEVGMYGDAVLVVDRTAPLRMVYGWNGAGWMFFPEAPHRSFLTPHDEIDMAWYATPAARYTFRSLLDGEWDGES